MSKAKEIKYEEAVKRNLRSFKAKGDDIEKERTRAGIRKDDARFDAQITKTMKSSDK